MLEKVDLSRKVEKEEYKNLKNQLEQQLVLLQRKTLQLKIPVMIVFEGWDAAGKGTLINSLILPLDPRGFNVYSTLPPNEDESLRPFLWRFWARTPAKGRIAIFDRSWYRRVLVDRVDKEIKGSELQASFDDIRSFERQLADDGNIIIKFFLHISKKEQKKRFKELLKNKATRWRVSEGDIKRHKQYNKYLSATEEMLSETDSDFAPWTIVEAHDHRFAALKMFNTIVNTLESKIAAIEEKAKTEKSEKPAVRKTVKKTLKALSQSVLDKVNLKRRLEREDYRNKLKERQEIIRELEHKIYAKRLPVVIVYEGWDAAGKGGNMRRLTQNLDPRGYEVAPIAAPNDVEKAHHYLWRFWTQMPKAGHIKIFDRSWYGRVLVERVEGFCKEADWKRAYREINEMEQHLVHFGAVLIKFWLHISKAEQLRRFEERQKSEQKRWKITDEDWRNREKWDIYKDAIDEMLYRTSTSYAPWTIVEANDKLYARIKALDTVIEAIDHKL